MKLGLTKKQEISENLLKGLEAEVGTELVDAILNNPEKTEAEKEENFVNLDTLKAKLATIDKPEAKKLSQLTEYLRKKSVWILGGDGWAYDIGYGGVDHVLAW